jgi:hypothetical protein
VPCRTILCHAAPYCATPHHTVPRRTIFIQKKTNISLLNLSFACYD